MVEATAASELVKDTTTANFRADVISESARQPVLVDFWAPWCGPCKQLTPVIEKVVKAAAGKVKLVKMNIDEHPQIAGQLGVQSIPAVIAFQKGQPVDGFMGALPESQIVGFLERLVGPLANETDELREAGLEALEAGNYTAAIESLRQVQEQSAGDAKAIGGLVRAYLGLEDLTTAREILDSAPAEIAGDLSIQTAKAALEIAEQAAALGDVRELEAKVAAEPKNHQTRFDLAIALNGKGMREQAADALLAIIKAERGWNDDGARKQLLQFFDAWGPMDPDTLSARRKLSGALFS